MPAKLMLEGDELSYTEYTRLAACFPETTVVNGTPLIRKARSVKTNIEIEMFRRSGIAHTKAYEQIPSVYRPGMTDRQLSIEIERLMRLEGCLGIFRTFGQSMEIFMGSLLAGDNATAPAPYDFALGGEGLDPSIPIGANGGRSSGIISRQQATHKYLHTLTKCTENTQTTFQTHQAFYFNRQLTICHSRSIHRRNLFISLRMSNTRTTEHFNFNICLYTTCLTDQGSTIHNSCSFVPKRFVPDIFRFRK